MARQNQCISFKDNVNIILPVLINGTMSLFDALLLLKLSNLNLKILDYGVSVVTFLEF